MSDNDFSFKATLREWFSGFCDRYSEYLKWDSQRLGIVSLNFTFLRGLEFLRSFHLGDPSDELDEQASTFEHTCAGDFVATVQASGKHLSKAACRSL